MQTERMTRARRDYLIRWILKSTYWSRHTANQLAHAIRMIYRDGEINTVDYAREIGTSREYAARLLRRLTKAHILTPVHTNGRGRTTRWTVAAPTSDAPFFVAERNGTPSTTLQMQSKEKYGKRTCERVWKETTQIKKGDWIIFRRSPWMRDLMLLARHQLRNSPHAWQRIVCGVLYRTVVAYKLTVERALLLLKTLLDHIKRKGVCTVKRVTWWTRQFLVGGKRRRDGKLFTPTKAQTTHTQQVQEQKQTHAPSDEYTALKQRLDQVGYEKLSRNEKRRWNELQLQRVGCQRPRQPQQSREFNTALGSSLLSMLRNIANSMRV